MAINHWGDWGISNQPTANKGLVFRPSSCKFTSTFLVYIVHAPHVLYSWYNINITACPTPPVLRHEKWKIVEFLDIIEVHTPLSSSMYHGPLEDYRFPIYNRSYLQYLVPRILKHPRPPLSSDWDKVMISWVYIQMHQRARTRLTWVHQGRGRRGGILALAHFPALLLSQVTDPPRIVQADFTIYSAVRESTSEGEKVWQIFRPKENFGRHTIHLPGHLDYHLIWRLYWSFSTFTMPVEFGKRQVRPHEGTWAMARRTAQLSTVNCLADNFLLQGVEHFSETQVSGW